MQKKQNLEKNVRDIDKKKQKVVDKLLRLFLTENLLQLRIKFLMLVVYLKSNHDTKISDIKGKFFNTSDYNKFLTDILDTETKLVSQQM